ncbi:MAG: OsmC family protein [Bacteroidota bacterium]|nr:OsmC family protein [Bacteroidota bacterium]
MQTTDKTKELSTTLVLVNDKLHFTGHADTNAPVSIDYIPPLGDNLGYTSLELFLLSISSCVGSAVLILLRKMGKTISEFRINSNGIRRNQHPTGFSNITLDILLKSPDATQADLDKVLSMSNEKLCPVWAMIDGNVEVKVNSEVIKAL